MALPKGRGNCSRSTVTYVVLTEGMTAQREVNVLTDCETFCLAFKMGAKIMLDVLTNGQMREI